MPAIPAAFASAIGRRSDTQRNIIATRAYVCRRAGLFEWSLTFVHRAGDAWPNFFAVLYFMRPGFRQSLGPPRVFVCKFPPVTLWPWSFRNLFCRDEVLLVGVIHFQRQHWGTFFLCSLSVVCDNGGLGSCF